MWLFEALVRLFFRMLVHVFFHDIEVVGDENIPQDGALIFVGNHQNQFVDFLLLTAMGSRSVSFLVAAVSLKRLVIQVFAYIMHCIPVQRQRDTATPGTGTIKSGSSATELVGNGTKFKDELEAGDTIYVTEKKPVRIALEVQVKEILADDKLILSAPAEVTLPDFTAFKLSRKVDQGQIYEQVWDTLGKGECIGIFPEGCSHDIPELLPLKAGVALMSLGTVAKHSVPVKIVPCGLNYFSGHRFRGHVVIQYGKPISIAPSDHIVDRYKDPKQRRTACGELLDLVTQSLRNVTLNAPTLEVLRAILLVRNLYQSKRLPPKEYLELNRAFAEGYIMFKDNPDVKSFSRDVQKYQKQLTAFGLKDYHVATGTREISTLSFLNTILRRFIRLSLLIILALPGMLINLPMMLFTRLYANQKAAASAKYDPHAMYGARDEVASHKIIFASFGIPMVWGVYCLVPYCLGYIEFKWGLMYFCILPFFSYASLRVVEKGIWEWRRLRVVLTIQRSKDKLVEIRLLRRDLQVKLRQLIRSLGPKLGKEWEQQYKGQLASSDGQRDWFEYLDEADLPKRNVDLEWRPHAYEKSQEKHKWKKNN